MDERKKWKNVNEEGRKNYRRLRNQLKRATEKTKKEYLEKLLHEIMEVQRRGRYDLMYMKMKELQGKKNHDVQSTGFEDYKQNITVDKSTENVEYFGFGEFNIGGPIIRTVKYADDLRYWLRKKVCYKA